jgi:hypothetical protein
MWSCKKYVLQLNLLILIGSLTTPASIQTVVGDQPSMIIAHISSPLIRNRLPGHYPAPLVRSRDALRLLEMAIEKAAEHNASAIVLTGSIIAAPPPLRVCDANFYYPMDRSTATLEAESDYCAVRDLLERSRLPYVVTPGRTYT